jgi:carboxymethylenebutenolidase
VGILGFCFGGRQALLFGARSREVDAVVAFHPGPVRPDEIGRLRAPVLLHHGTADASVPHTASRDIARALAENGVEVELHLYDGADHGFLAYTRPFYRPDHAQLAWDRTLAFLHRRLAAPAPASAAHG